jgi:hypothetical protein
MYNSELLNVFAVAEAPLIENPKYQRSSLEALTEVAELPSAKRFVRE